MAALLAAIQESSFCPESQVADLNNTPDRIRICDLSFRKAALYPTELLGHQ